MSTNCESTRLKKSSSNWLKSGKAVLQHLIEKMQVSCFRLLPGSAEALVRRDAKTKRIFIAYFFHNIYAKNYQNWSTCVKVIASQMCDNF